MATTVNHFIHTPLILRLFIDVTVAQVGVCFGRLGYNLPSAARTVALYKKHDIRRMRIYDPHPPILRALAGTGIRLMLGVPHDHLRNLANCPDIATAWVRTNILRFPNVTFRDISVRERSRAGIGVRPVRPPDNAKYILSHSCSRARRQDQSVHFYQNRSSRKIVSSSSRGVQMQCELVH
ncbi:beta-1 [Perilla frutescens var. frutescens]|nr:beta-1 [Perilla frutescens var. frutescens]